MNSFITLDVECIICNKSLQKITHNPWQTMNRIGKISNRRSRTPNWSVEEKQYLLELIRDRKEVVVIKANNGPNYYEDKDAAWKSILRELAMKFGSKFSESSTKKVKTQWQNMKRIAREEIGTLGTLEKLTRQSVDVCHILDMVQDGVLKRDTTESMEQMFTTNVEVKAERIDDDLSQPSCSDLNKDYNLSNNDCQNQDSRNDEAVYDISSPSASEHISEVYGNNAENINPEVNNSTAESLHKGCMTQLPDVAQTMNLNPFHRKLQEFLEYNDVEKQIKMESLKEERQVVRAMRETAELNKIIAEQRLKQILWLKKRQTAMYSGEPGSGAGKGGGGGGAIREAGGSFGKMEAAREDEYFYKKQREQLQTMKGHLSKEITFHEEQIKRHEDAIRRHKEQMTDIDKK